MINNIQDISLDLEKKLIVYKNNHYIKEQYAFAEQKYIDLVNILLNLSVVDIEKKIEYFNNKYIEDKQYYSIYLKNKKLIYPTHNISALASQLFNTLYHKEKNTSFEYFTDLLANKVANDDGSEHCFTMYFKNDEIKDYLLDEATQFIVKNQTTQEKLIENIKSIELNNNYKFSGIKHLDPNNIPKKFNNLFEMYQWFNIDQANNYIHHFGSSFTKSLLSIVIDNEDTTLYYKNHFKRIDTILDKCQSDSIVINKIFNSFDINIKLNIFLLAHPEYTQIGLLNIITNNDKINIQSNDYDYGKEWQKLILKQSVDIYFQHYNNTSFDKESIFNTLNYLAYYGFKYDKQNQYLLALEFMLDKFETYSISWQYKKEFYFDQVIEKLVDNQIQLIEESETLEIKDYFLTSWYLGKLHKSEKIYDKDYTDLISKITDSIGTNIKRHFICILNDRFFYLEDDRLEKINFSLFYNSSKTKSVWLKVIDIENVNSQINKDNKSHIYKVLEYYFAILLDIYINHQDDIQLQRYIIKLAISFGVKVPIGILHSFNDNPLLNKFLESLNFMNDDIFEEFIEEFFKHCDIKQILQLYSYTNIDERKRILKDKLTPKLDEDHDFIFLPDISNTINMALAHDLNQFADRLLRKYEDYLATDIGKHKDQSLLKYVKCKKAILEIYKNKDLSQSEKFNELDNLKILKYFDKNNYNEQSLASQCNEYEEFIKGLIFFNDAPDKTYRILKQLFERRKNSLYLFNMLSAYFEIFKKHEHKVIKYTNILKEFENDINISIKKDKDLFYFHVLFYGYHESDNHAKLNELYSLAPDYYKQNLQDQLPTTIKLFDKQIYIKSKLLICVEGKHDINFLKNINKHIPELNEIIDIEANEYIDFFDLKGSNLKQFVKENSLVGTNIIEFHLYDSDKGSGKNENQYSNTCDKVNNRDDKSFCLMANKRELENYIHKKLIEKRFNFVMSDINNWDFEDIPTFIQNKTSKTEEEVKNVLNGCLSQQITKQYLEDLNAFDEVRTWFEKIKELSNV